MKKMRNFGLLTICAVLSLTMFLSACTTTGSSDPRSGIDVAGIMNPVGTLPIINEPVTFTVAVSQRSGFDFVDNLISDYFEEATGVRVEWIQIPEADWETRINLMLATGDVPDIIVNSLGNHARVYYYAQLGLFRPITNYLEYAPELMKMFEELPEIHGDMIMPDGNIYGFPAIDDCFHCSIPQKLWINTRWLDNLGLDMPTTTEELYDVLVAFRDGDPNGDGSQVIPFAGAMSQIGQGHSIERLLGRFVTTDEGNRMIVQDGKITPVFNTDEWRDGLRYLNRLYSEGLVAPDTFTQDRNGLRAMGDNPGHALVGVFPGLWLGQMISTDFSDQQGRWNDYRVIPVLETPCGRAENFIRPLQGNHRAVITSTLPVELMPIAVRWLDNFYTEISTLWSIQGTQDVHWRFADEGEVSIAGGQARWERIISPEGATQSFANLWGTQPVPNWRSNDWRLSEKANRTIVEQETLLYDETVAMITWVNDLDIIVPVLIYNEEQSAQLVDIQAPLNTFVTESLARFTVGDLCVENDWDWYVRELEVMGLERLLELMQAAFDQRAR